MTDNPSGNDDSDDEDASLGSSHVIIREVLKNLPREASQQYILEYLLDCIDKSRDPGLSIVQDRQALILFPEIHFHIGAIGPGATGSSNMAEGNQEVESNIFGDIAGGDQVKGDKVGGDQQKDVSAAEGSMVTGPGSSNRRTVAQARLSEASLGKEDADWLDNASKLMRKVEQKEVEKIIARRLGNELQVFADGIREEDSSLKKGAVEGWWKLWETLPDPAQNAIVAVVTKGVGPVTRSLAAILGLPASGA